MTRTRLSALFTGALLATAFGLGATACGSGGVPAGAVAVVDGTEIPRSELDALVEQAKKSYKASKQEFPKVGTPEYQGIQQEYVAFLVQKVELEKEAEKLEVKVTEKDIDKAQKQFVKDTFGGDEKKFRAALAKQDYSLEAFRKTLRVSVLSQKIYDAVTKDVEISDAEALAHYTQNQAQYREQVDYAKSKKEADRLYAQLRGGADFAALAKKHSDDTSSKATGGKYTAVRGQSVPEFDKVAYELKKNEISTPVKTQFGYHIIQALSDPKKDANGQESREVRHILVAEPGKVTPFEDVKAGIKAQLRQEERNEVVNQWVEDLQKRYEDKVSYAAGFEPPEIPEAPTDTETEPATE
jgi:parvulin-like peptidyl-prolyl isomerase